MDGDYYLDEEFKTTLEDFENVESKTEDLKKHVQVANECVKNLRDQIQKFKSRHREVNKELNKVNETIVNLKL